MIRARPDKCFAIWRSALLSADCALDVKVTIENSPPDRSARAHSRQTVVLKSDGLASSCAGATSRKNKRGRRRIELMRVIGVRFKVAGKAIGECIVAAC